MFQELTANFVGGVRRDRLDGREHLVAPMVMLVEGVHAGSGGPVLYVGSELAKAPREWDGKPVTIDHPHDGSRHVSALSAGIATRKVGVILNTRFDAAGRKLQSDAWLDVERLKSLDARVFAAVSAGKPVEISTGLFVERIGPSGTWNGQSYVAIARNFKPDHLAILPDAIGACSIASGCGLVRNEGTTMTRKPLSLPTTHPDGIRPTAGIFIPVQTLTANCGCDSKREPLRVPSTLTEANPQPVTNVRAPLRVPSTI